MSNRCFWTLFDLHFWHKQCGHDDLWLTKKRQVDLTVGASGNFSDSTPVTETHQRNDSEDHSHCKKNTTIHQRFDLPQWKTAFTSRLSDKNKSGFRLRAYESDRANEQSTWLKTPPLEPVNHPRAPPTTPSLTPYVCLTLETNQPNVHIQCKQIR